MKNAAYGSSTVRRLSGYENVNDSCVWLCWTPERAPSTENLPASGVVNAEVQDEGEIVVNHAAILAGEEQAPSSCDTTLNEECGSNLCHDNDIEFETLQKSELCNSL